MAARLFFLSLLLPAVLAAEPGSLAGGEGVREGCPDAFAVAYRVIEGTESPDGRMAVIAGQSRLLGSTPESNFLVTLQPFHIVAALNVETVAIPNQHKQMETVWAKDGSAVAVIVTDVPRRADSSLDSITLVQLEKGAVVAQTDLLMLAPAKGGLEPDGDKPVCRMLPNGRLAVTGKHFRKVWSIPGGKWLPTP